MKIAVISGKGGTGKTLVSVNIAAAVREACYIDCDVEEPNGYLFFRPTGVKTEKVSVKIPFADQSLCNGCRKCVDFCKFNALAYVKNRLIVFDEVCHSCGGCLLVCPQKAIREKEKVIGEIQQGNSEGVTILTGILNVGEASGVPIIKKLLKEECGDEDIVLIDCPPGSACTVMESIIDADYCVLVGEPTLFGVHNLSLVYELVRLFKKPHGVILNKCLEGRNPSEKFCEEKGIKIIGRIPYDPELGKLNSDAKIAVRESEAHHHLFSGLFKIIIEEMRNETAIDT